MNWILLTLSSIILWGITDIFLKKSLHQTDSLSHFKTFVLARLFLKEHLSKKQYISLGFVVLGVVLLGFADIFGV